MQLVNSHDLSELECDTWIRPSGIALKHLSFLFCHAYSFMFALTSFSAMIGTTLFPIRAVCFATGYLLPR